MAGSPQLPRAAPYDPDALSWADRPRSDRARARSGGALAAWKSALESAEDQLDGAVDFAGLRCIEAACEVSEAARVDGSHLVD